MLHVVELVLAGSEELEESELAVCVESVVPLCDPEPVDEAVPPVVPVELPEVGVPVLVVALLPVPL